MTETDVMNIEIKNCNSIDSGEIEIKKSILNIKYGINGTGKSTLAKALILAKTNPDDLVNLMPFKLQEQNPDELTPSVSGADEIESVMVFNEDYLQQFVFKEDELVENSFDIFIKTPSYEAKITEIEGIISTIKNVFKDHEALDALMSDLNDLTNSFKLTKTGISKTSNLVKSLGEGNKVEHIPEGLESYTPFLRNKKNVTWLDWQLKGVDFMDIADDCPFCTSPTAEKLPQIEKLGKEYNKNTIRHLNSIIGAVERLGKYFSDEVKDKLLTITKLKGELGDDHIAFLVHVKSQIDSLLGKLSQLKMLSSQDFADTEKAAEELEGLKIDMTYLDDLKSDETTSIIAGINESLDEVQKSAGKLQGEINKQRIEIQKSIEGNQNEINEFLKYAGIKYEVCLRDEGGEYRLKLHHVDCKRILTKGDQHLSFGEKNAFSLVLFMYECLSTEPDLIILDDPISSFDKNKKYAILEMLFRKKRCLKRKTVLMLTHDIEPVIDTVKVLRGAFHNLAQSRFIKAFDGVVSEQAITSNDIQTFAQICKTVLVSEKDDVIKLIYLRRHYEILDEKGDEYQLISNLLHKRDTPVDSRLERDGTTEEYPEMKAEKVGNAVTKISYDIADFDYDRILTELKDTARVCALYSASSNGYEKLQLYRILDTEHENTIVRKFINESYHIENEFICQLDPTKFDVVPQFVVAECNAEIAKLAI